MKIDNKTLLLIGGVLFAYFIFRKLKPTKYGGRGNCASSYGPQGLIFEGKCQKCPEIVTQNGSAAPTSFQNECMKTGRSRGNLEGTMDIGNTDPIKECPIGMVKKPIRGPQYGIKPLPQQEERDRKRTELARLNAPCILSEEARAIRERWKNEPLRQ